MTALTPEQREARAALRRTAVAAISAPDPDLSAWYEADSIALEGVNKLDRPYIAAADPALILALLDALDVHTLVGPAAMDKLIEIYLCGFGSGVVTCLMSALGDKVGAEEFARGEADGLTRCMDRDPLMVERIRDEIIEILSGTETPKRRPLKVVLP
ncbi:MAG: hypothetical protein IPM11_00655 [Micropruina sp.]|nr:hypothetical protein [Micropruina sp.]